MRLALLVVLAAACSKTSTSKQLDPQSIVVIDNARLRTDTVGVQHHESRVGDLVTITEDTRFASESTFVLVDAKNPTTDGAYVTLAGELTGEGGKVVGQLKAQSLWIPAGERRTFALVDRERVPRPETTSARIEVTGALIPTDPPRARIADLHTFDDHGKIVVQGNLVNDADRIGKIVVIAAFHAADDRPMTRPFQVIEIDRKGTRFVQFVGPPDSKTGTIYVGDVVY